MVMHTEMVCADPHIGDGAANGGQACGFAAHIPRSFRSLAYRRLAPALLLEQMKRRSEGLSKRNVVT